MYYYPNIQTCGQVILCGEVILSTSLSVIWTGRWPYTYMQRYLLNKNKNLYTYTTHMDTISFIQNGQIHHSVTSLQVRWSALEEQFSRINFDVKYDLSRKTHISKKLLCGIYLISKQSLDLICLQLVCRGIGAWDTRVQAFGKFCTRFMNNVIGMIIRGVENWQQTAKLMYG